MNETSDRISDRFRRSSPADLRAAAVVALAKEPAAAVEFKPVALGAPQVQITCGLDGHARLSATFVQAPFGVLPLAAFDEDEEEEEEIEYEDEEDEEDEDDDEDDEEDDELDDEDEEDDGLEEDEDDEEAAEEEPADEEE